jgi:hypothetical protein
VGKLHEVMDIGEDTRANDHQFTQPYYLKNYDQPGTGEIVDPDTYGPKWYW